MKIKNWTTRYKPETLEIKSDPLVVWLSNTKQLIIERGDTIEQVCGIIRAEWGLGRREALQLAAYWFALGERGRAPIVAAWSRGELDSSPARRYQPKNVKSARDVHSQSSARR